MDVRKSAALLASAVNVGRADLARDGRIRPATWDVIDAAADQLDAALAELDRTTHPRLLERR